MTEPQTSKRDFQEELQAKNINKEASSKNHLLSSQRSVSILSEESRKPYISTKVSQDLGKNLKQNLNYYPVIVDEVAFLNTAIPQGYTMQFQIIKDKESSRIHGAQYSLTTTSDNKHLMTAQKGFSLCCSNFNIKTSQNEQIGEMSSNMLGTQFQLFGKGTKASKATHPNQIRTQLGVFEYENMILKSGCKIFLLNFLEPKTITCTIPSIQKNGSPREVKSFDDNSLVVDKSTNVIKLQNQKPAWNSNIQAYVLNFSERVKMPSVKNFIMKQSQNGQLMDQESLQFGFASKNILNLDVSYPFSPLQAFALAISNLESKIACD